MLVNTEKKKTTSAVEFVSYSGKYPSLCMGCLTVKINGETVKFGAEYSDGKFVMHNNSFWSSGGSCGFSGGYSESYCTSGEWKIDVQSIPKQYRKYASELDAVFNANVPYGCCGGCL